MTVTGPIFAKSIFFLRN